MWLFSTNMSVAVCCSVLQCVAVCCSVLQCVAVCCSVLQKITYFLPIWVFRVLYSADFCILSCRFFFWDHIFAQTCRSVFQKYESLPCVVVWTLVSVLGHVDRHFFWIKFWPKMCLNVMNTQLLEKMSFFCMYTAVKSLFCLFGSLFCMCRSLFCMCRSLFCMCWSLFCMCRSLFCMCRSLFCMCRSLFCMCRSLFCMCRSLFCMYTADCR